MLPQAEASTPGSFLYNELVDMVIDHLHDDKDALAACSLVSRLWRNSSQYHLLENVTLHGVATARGLDAFAAFVETSPRLAHYVRALRVHGEGSWFGKFEHDRMRELCLRPKHARFLARLPALRRLFLFEMLWDSSQDGTDTGTTIQDQTLDAHLRGSLEKLVLQHMTSLRFQQAGEIHYGVYAQDVLDVLSFFPDIKTLNFSTPRFEVGGPEESVAGLEESFLRLRFPPRLRVQSLIADADGMDSVRSALAYTLLDRACSVRSLHTFKAKVKPGDLEAVSHFVAVRSPFIRHYELDLSAYFTLARLGEWHVSIGAYAHELTRHIGRCERDIFPPWSLRLHRPRVLRAPHPLLPSGLPLALHLHRALQTPTFHAAHPRARLPHLHAPRQPPRREPHVRPPRAPPQPRDARVRAQAPVCLRRGVPVPLPEVHTHAARDRPRAAERRGAEDLAVRVLPRPEPGAGVHELPLTESVIRLTWYIDEV